MTERHSAYEIRLDGISWDEWRDTLEDHHEYLRSTFNEFDGLGPRPIMNNTGEESWQQFWREGYTPQEALTEYRFYRNACVSPPLQMRVPYTFH